MPDVIRSSRFSKKPFAYPEELPHSKLAESHAQSDQAAEKEVQRNTPIIFEANDQVPRDGGNL